MTVKINIGCRQFKKENSSMKKSLFKSMELLGRKIEAAGSDLSKACNNDSLIYDRINSEINIYKTHCRDNTQMRIVYGFDTEDGESVIYLIDYVNKKKNGKEYIRCMNEKFRNVKLSQLEFTEVII